MDDVLSSFVPDAFGNYIGPGWSDGKLQESVEWGQSDPRDELDLLAYYHDSAYAKFKDEKHRMEADRIFTEKAAKIPGGLAAISKVAVTHGNMVKRSAERTASNVSTGASLFGPIGALGGLVYTGVQNIVKANDMLPGGANEKARKEVLSYYDTDPHKRQNMKFPASNDVTTKKETPKPKEAAAPRAEYEAPARTPRTYTQEELEDMAEIKRTAEKRRKPKKGAPAAPVQSVPEFENVPQKNQLEQIHTHKASKPTEPPKDSEVRVNDPRSLFSRLFKRKKKKHAKLVPVETEDQRNKRLIESQAANFRRQQELHDAAKRSTLRPSERVFVNKQGQSLAALDHGSRVRRAYSSKRITQISEVGGVKQR